MSQVLQHADNMLCRIFQAVVVANLLVVTSTPSLTTCSGLNWICGTASFARYLWPEFEFSLEYLLFLMEVLSEGLGPLLPLTLVIAFLVWSHVVFAPSYLLGGALWVLYSNYSVPLVICLFFNLVKVPIFNIVMTSVKTAVGKLRE